MYTPGTIGKFFSFTSKAGFIRRFYRYLTKYAGFREHYCVSGIYNKYMEIPPDLKNLYKHWPKHSLLPNSEDEIFYNNDILQQIYIFISERMRIWEKKYSNHKPPYTTDPILATYRFCNIYRELDKQTIEIHTLLKSLEADFDLWLLNIIFCRMVCRTKTVLDVGLLSYDNESNLSVYSKLTSYPRPKYGSAYIFPISLLNTTKLNSREEFFCFYLPRITKQISLIIRDLNDSSVVDAIAKILPVFGFNFKFHWAEILIDVAYQFPEYLNLFKSFPIGPGSLPTMKKLNPRVEPIRVALNLASLRVPNFPYLTYNGKIVQLSSENWEGIGCEFRKYSNLVNGVGRHRFFSSVKLM